MKKIRCAIYTRKSAEEGLEQDFNSLDAQRTGPPSAANTKAIPVIDCESTKCCPLPVTVCF